MGMASAKGPAGSAASAVKIDIRDFKYVPETVAVRAGSRVTWVNDDAAPHTATAAGVFDTGTLQKGDSKALTLSKPGSYSYVCEFHPFMKATVVVK
jgi:plastocyanin